MLHLPQQLKVNMSASKKLITSVKALSCLAKSKDRPMQSKDVAEKINCNASKLRSLFAMLVKSEIISSSKGSNGGFQLIKNADEINLQQIYCAVEDRKAFHMDFNCEDPNEIPDYENYFEELFQKIQFEIEDKLKTITLTDIIKKTKRNEYGFLEKITY